MKHVVNVKMCCTISSTYQSVCENTCIGRHRQM